MKKLPALVAIACIALASCVSEPEVQKAPDWVLSVPPADATYTYFVGHSSSPTGDLARATEDATANLVANIMNYIGTKITVDSTATARATYESYEADVVQTVRSQSSGRLAGFMVKETYKVTDRNGTLMVYILASYVTADLNKEKARIAAAFKEVEDAVAKPEAAGDAAAADGRWFDSIRSYVEAAVAASGADITNADIKAERNVNKARTILSRLRFIRVEAPSSAGLGKPYAGPFVAKLVYGEADSAPGIPGAEVFVAYQRRQSSGRVVSRTERAVTDQRGVVSFTPPPPDFVGKATLSFRLNLESTEELLERLPARFQAYKDALSEDLAGRTLLFEYTIASEARNVPTAIFVVDLDAAGKPAGTTGAQGGLMEALAKESFKVSMANLDPALAAAMDDAGIAAAAKATLGATVGRIIYGTARIDSVTKDGSMFQITARMTVRCVDLATGALLYSTEKTAITVATDEASGRRTALAQVARDTVAKDLMANLP